MASTFPTMSKSNLDTIWTVNELEIPTFRWPFFSLSVTLGLDGLWVLKVFCRLDNCPFLPIEITDFCMWHLKVKKKLEISIVEQPKKTFTTWDSIFFLYRTFKNSVLLVLLKISSLRVIRIFSSIWSACFECKQILYFSGFCDFVAKNLS